MKNKSKMLTSGWIALFAAVVCFIAGCARPAQSPAEKEKTTVSKVSVRYIVNDVNSAVEFYTKFLGFEVEINSAPGFASLSRGNLRLLLNAPGAGGAGQSMSDGQKPAPGGWNRVQIEVQDLASTVETLRQAKARFRNEIVNGNGGKQILLEDPAGNPIELFEPHPK